MATYAAIGGAVRVTVVCAVDAKGFATRLTVTSRHTLDAKRQITAITLVSHTTIMAPPPVTGCAVADVAQLTVVTCKLATALTTGAEEVVHADVAQPHAAVVTFETDEALLTLISQAGSALHQDTAGHFPVATFTHHASVDFLVRCPKPDPTVNREAGVQGLEWCCIVNVFWIESE